MKVEINTGVNCSITLLIISELKVRNSTLINLHLSKCLNSSLWITSQFCVIVNMRLKMGKVIEDSLKQN